MQKIIQKLRKSFIELQATSIYNIRLRHWYQKVINQPLFQKIKLIYKVTAKKS